MAVLTKIRALRRVPLLIKGAPPASRNGGENVRVRVIRQFLNGSKVVSEGTELTVTERRAEQLERNKLVVPIGIGERERARREQRGAARPSGIVGPTQDTDMDLAAPTMATPATTAEPQSGGPTGEVTPPSSSRRGRPPKTRLSSELAAAPVS